MRKRFLAAITSFILIFSVGTTSALAENGPGASSLFTGNDVSEMSETESFDSGDSYSDTDQTSAETGENGTDHLDGSAIENGEISMAEDDGIEEETASYETLTGVDEETEEAGEDYGESGENNEEPDEENEEEEEEGDEEKEDAEEEIASLSLTVDDYLNDTTDLGSISLQYDDRYDLSLLNDNISSDEAYTLFMKNEDNEDNENISSYQVVNGSVSSKKDVSLLTQTKAGSTEVAASGVGSGDVYLIRTEDLKKLKTLEEASENTDPANPDETTPDDGNTVDETPDSGEMVDIYKVNVTVEPAPLTLMFLAGQSNMEGFCSASTGYERGVSIACTDGTVYSTYAPSTTENGSNITGLSFSSACTASNAGSFVAGSLQGAATSVESSEDSSYANVGALADPLNMSGGTLEYSLSSLTEEGSGKTGPDSALAYEWNQLTGDKVWVINTAYRSTTISGWVPGSTYYTRSAAVWSEVLKTYEAEITAGHYTDGSVSGNKMVFWLQGETGDSSLSSAATYESSFGSMYDGMCSDLEQSNIPLGIIMVRAGDLKSSPTTEKDLYMTAPRIAQYFLGSSNSSYKNVFVVSNANEQWVTDSGVAAYFKNNSVMGISYPMQSASKSLPTTVAEVHSDKHYSQVGHNENGLSAAYGMWAALGNTSNSCSVTWKDADGTAVSSIELEYSTDTTKVVPVPDPVYMAKSVTYSKSGDEDEIFYDFATGNVTGATDSSTGTLKIAGSGSNGTLTLKVLYPVDLSAEAGKNYTGLYKYNGTWFYLKNGIVQTDVTSVVKNENGWWYVENGRVDKTYTGFATNENGSWYMENGKLLRDQNTVIKDTNGALGSKDEWYYVVGSKVQSGYTGVANYKNSSGWWYVTNGRVDRSYTGVAKNNNGWWYVKNGKVDKTYTGFATNENGSWYMENGKLLRDQNTVIKDTKGALGSTSEWYYVVGSKVQKDFTGLANYSNSSGWWYITNGKVDRTVNTVAKNKNGWYYVVDGKVQKSFTGLANYKNDSGWWYIKNGKVDRTFTGIAENKNGWYYLKNGKVQKSYTGTVTVNGTKYSVTNGKVAK